MIPYLFRMYRASPFWLRNVAAGATWPLRLAMLPFRSVHVDGYRMVLDFMDNASFKYYTDRERYEYRETTAFLASIVHNPGSYVLDVGANYGAFTLAAARLGRLGVIRRILAFEPDTRPFRALQKSIAVNNFGDLVRAYPTIVSDRDGQETLFVNARSSADNRAHRVSTAPIRVRSTHQVSSTTIDSALAREPIPLDSKFIIKMDIQGNEPLAFRGMRDVLSRAEGFLVFFEHCPYLIRSAGIDLGEYVDFLKRVPFDACFEFADERVIRLDGIRGLIESFQAVEQSVETRMEGAGSDYVLAKNMCLTGLTG
jgi:FkbM family methyltransferase